MNRQFTLYADECFELGVDLPVGAEVLFVMLPAVLVFYRKHRRPHPQ
jgi:hypothetical protein